VSTPSTLLCSVWNILSVLSLRYRSHSLVADESEREGYVPNVVYSCGPMIHGNNIVPSYGRSDSSVPGYRRRPSRWGAAGRCDRERSAAGVASVEQGLASATAISAW
jgi:hypothetical protein